ncbi:multiheme c-type cytochrome [Leptospira yasudae]|uniref:Cytochrome c554 and C-prime n=1 Tax=Leptospira yasudae TaxID=2202201 RepID=A0ABX9M033_9LEPT|nr:multiheme c-type cytochrome [Leptospira yasudae]RHX78302.1 hypothetical protein DLM77_17885 [Leptospira yasudae]
MKLAPFLLGLISLFLLFADRIPDLGFSQGMFSLDLKSDPEFLSANSCGNCHLKEYEEWEESRHHLAYTNKIFQDGLSVENKSECKNCHGPIDSKREEGVNCSVCHLRENSILTGNKSPDSSFHSFRKLDIISTSEFCANCHQFNFLKTKNENSVLTQDPMQNTYQEWLEYSSGNLNAISCQGCHMPEGKHTFRGAHDLEYLKSAIKVEASRVKNQVLLSISTQNIGHQFPTGDLFRFATLEVRRKGSDYELIEWIGKTFQTRWDSKNGEFTKFLKSDSSIKPGEIRKFKINSALPVQYRLLYHYTSEKDEERGTIPLNLTIRQIASGKI